MQPSGVFRYAPAFFVAGLFIQAQAPAFCQAPDTPQPMVVTKTDTYFLGSPQMIVSAIVDDITVNPEGRYTLIYQTEAALPPGPFLGTPTTGAVALILYDAKLRKTRTLWERRADGGQHSIYDVKWLPGTDSAVVVTLDTPPDNGAKPPEGAVGSCTLLLFNFGKSNVGRVLATTPKLFKLNVSPTKPIFIMQDWEGHQARMVNAQTGTLGPTMSSLNHGYTVFPWWSTDGTTVYGVRELPKDPSKVSNYEAQSFSWDGKSPEVTVLAERPPRSLFAKKSTPPSLPIVLRTDTLPMPSSTKSAGKVANAPVAVLHPLFLEASGDVDMNDSLNRSFLVAPSSDKAYLLADQSAILYQSGNALYTAPLVHFTNDTFAQLQKTRAMQKGKQIGAAILLYVQDHPEAFPPSATFEDSVRPHMREDPAGPNIKQDEVFHGFTYINPNKPPGSIASRATALMGYVTTSRGRAALYVDGHVQWEDKP